MKFGIELVPNMKVEEVVSLAASSESNGFDFVWITDHYNNRNVYATLASIALGTKKVFLGPGITNTYLIHPAWTASAVATINEISGGRAVLGVGPGDMVTFGKLGVQMEKPLTRIKEVVGVIRTLHTGGKASSEFFKIKGAKLDYQGGRIPIYVGAQGEKMLQLAGEIGDGALINASHPRDFVFAAEQIKKGIKEQKDFDVVAYTCFSIDRDAEKAKKAAKIVVAFIVAGSPDVVHQRHGLDMGSVGRVKEAMNAAFTKGAWKELGASVTDGMMDAFAIYGTPQQCVEKIKELLKSGVTQVVIGSPIGGDRKAAIELIGKEIIPSFRQ